jgi:hypothetical protein
MLGEIAIEQSRNARRGAKRLAIVDGIEPLPTAASVASAAARAPSTVITPNRPRVSRRWRPASLRYLTMKERTPLGKESSPKPFSSESQRISRSPPGGSASIRRLVIFGIWTARGRLWTALDHAYPVC